MNIQLGKEYYDFELQQPCLVVALDDLLGAGVIYKGENTGVTWIQKNKLGVVK